MNVKVDMRSFTRAAGVTQKALEVIALLAIASYSCGSPDEIPTHLPDGAPSGTPEPIPEVRAFITTWKVPEYDLEITIPTFPDEVYDYTVDWGDENMDEEQTGDAIHTYAEEGEYEVRITGEFPRIYFNNNAEDRMKITVINQWGDISWSSMEGAFAGCSRLKGETTDTPDLSNVKSMSSMFQNARRFDQDINGWDVLNVINMNSMFRNAHAFNQDISDWDVSNVTDMSSMFHTATSFDQNLEDWEISSLTTAENMFFGAELSSGNYDSLLMGWLATANEGTSENQILFHGGKSTPTSLSETAKNTLTREDTSGKFWAIIDSLNAFVTTWEVSAGDSITIPTCPTTTCPNLTYSYKVDWGGLGTPDIVNNYNATTQRYTGDATYTYTNAGDYEVKITGDFPRIYFNLLGDRNKITAINQWGSIHWASMRLAFAGCSNLAGQATDTPDLSNVTDMGTMFALSPTFNQDIGDWDTSQVTDMSFMFNRSPRFNQDIGNWNTSQVTDMSGIFLKSLAFNQDIGAWDTSQVTDMLNMFSGASSFDQDIGNWNTSQVTTMSDMFKEAIAFNQNISDWDVCKVTDIINLPADLANGATSFQDIATKYPSFNDSSCPASP